MTTFFDTNSLIYLLDKSSIFHESSISRLKECKARGPVIICDIVYCEFSIGMVGKEAVDAAVSTFSFERFRGSDEALIRAGNAFKSYKDFVKLEKQKQNQAPDSDEKRIRVLPDFYIGAIAETEDAPLVTKDGKHYKNWFKNLSLILLNPTE